VGQISTGVDNGVDLIGHGLEHVLQELPGGLSVSCRNELGDGEFGRPVNAYKEIELAFNRLHLGDVDAEEPDGVALELLALGLVALYPAAAICRAVAGSDAALTASNAG